MENAIYNEQTISIDQGKVMEFSKLVTRVVFTVKGGDIDRVYSVYDLADGRTAVGCIWINSGKETLSIFDSRKDGIFYFQEMKKFYDADPNWTRGGRTDDRTTV